MIMTSSSMAFGTLLRCRRESTRAVLRRIKDSCQNKWNTLGFSYAFQSCLSPSRVLKCLSLTTSVLAPNIDAFRISILSVEGVAGDEGEWYIVVKSGRNRYSLLSGNNPTLHFTSRTITQSKNHNTRIQQISNIKLDSRSSNEA